LKHAPPIFRYLLLKGPIVEPRWFDVDTAARYLCMSRHAIYHRVSRRQIPFVKEGGTIRFDRHALDRWMSKGVRNGFGETGRDLVLHEADQRSAVSRVHRFADKKSAERCAVEIEHDIRAGIPVAPRGTGNVVRMPRRARN
jgi:excisionase family DNA binding protein